jgi:hypothetical protein
MIRRQTPAVRRISAARSDAQSRQQRGQPAAQETSPLVVPRSGRGRSHFRGGRVKSQPEMLAGSRSAQIDNCGSNRQRRRRAQAPRRLVIRMWRRLGDRQKGRAARIHKHSNRPVFRKRLCQTNLLQALPAGASRVASVHRRVTHQVEGGSQPKGPGSNPSRRHALITPRGKRPLKYGVPAVIEISSTETSASFGSIRRRHSPMRCKAISRRRGARRCSNR